MLILGQCCVTTKYFTFIDLVHPCFCYMFYSVVVSFDNLSPKSFYLSGQQGWCFIEIEKITCFFLSICVWRVSMHHSLLGPHSFCCLPSYGIGLVCVAGRARWEMVGCLLVTNNVTLDSNYMQNKPLIWASSHVKLINRA